MAEKLFISHASEDRAVVAHFVHLLEDGLGFQRPQIVCSSLPGYGFAPGTPFDNDIREHIRTADALFALVSPAFLTSGYCMAEVGVAWGLDRPIVPLLLPNMSTEQARLGPLSRLNLTRLAETGTLDSLRDTYPPGTNGHGDFMRWQDRRDQFLSLAFRDVSRTEIPPESERGFWSGRILDGTLYTYEDLKTRGLREQVLQALENGRPIPPHIFYVTDRGAERWIALAQDPSFLAYQDSLDLVWNRSREITQQILDAAGSRSIDIVSLGPGDGRKDAALLHELMRAPDRASAFIYYPFDISVNMLARTAARLREDPVIRAGLRQAKAVIADFDSLPIFKPVYQYRPGPNLLCLLGNMLGNFSDDFGFLKRLHDRAMLKDDLLLLEVRLRSEQSRQAVHELIRDDSLLSARFDFGPLEMLGVPFEPGRLTYEIEPDRGTIRGSDTIVASYAEAVVGKDTFRDIDLSYVHRYEQERFLTEVQRAGFQVVEKWRSRQQHNLWVLLQKVKD